jgi:hypothetical protein
VALPEGESAGLVAYGLGKETADDGFQLLRGGHVLAITETVVRSAIGSIKLRAPNDTELFAPYYAEMKDEEHPGGTFADPGQEADQLYEVDKEGVLRLTQRVRRPDNKRTRVWYGAIGSGDKLIKNASKRNALRDQYNLIGIEMEAAGTINRIPVGVIRGVCDYADERKNKHWQPYAAAMAAAYAKAVLEQIKPREEHGKGTHQYRIGNTVEMYSKFVLVFHVPFRQNRRFTGRQTQLQKLWQMLFTENIERVALVGLGGIGKTQIALELAYRVRHAEKQYSVLWMPAHGAAAFEKAATELVRKLAIPCGAGDDPKEALQGYLASDAAGFWLLILDNVDDMNILDGFPGGSHGLFDVLPHSLKGRTLLTTRSLEIAVHVASSDVVELAEMTPNEAHALLEKSLINKTQLDQADGVEELLRKLTYLPLTISQAAAYINVKKLPITAYLRLCNHTNEGMINLLSTYLRDETHYSKTQGAMATTWIVSFTAICEADGVAARLLSFIRWIEPKSIPQSVLPKLDSNWAQTQAIGLLCAYGFMSWRADSETLDMHSLVHLALRFWLGQSERSLMTKQDAVEHLQKIFPSDEWENRVLWRQYLPHTLPLIRDHGSEGSTSSLILDTELGGVYTGTDE